jgi:hypothetical protein
VLNELLREREATGSGGSGNGAGFVISLAISGIGV